KGLEIPPERAARHGKGDVHLHLHKDTYHDNSQLTTFTDKSRVTITNNITNLPELRNSFTDFAELMEKRFPHLEKKMEKLSDQLYQLDTGSDKKALKAPLGRLGDFLTKLGDENSEYSTFINGSAKAVEYTQKLVDIYDNLARWVPGLPRIPEALRNKES
ncbi:MAG: hypothetical protein GY757_08655, partial [bacterium]|nr:hypothetical protein [bacterium]